MKCLFTVFLYEYEAGEVGLLPFNAVTLKDNALLLSTLGWQKSFKDGERS
jgi:hypothetical protein